MAGICRTSGVKTASAVITSTRAMLTSLHITSNNDAAGSAGLVTIKVFNSNSASLGGKTEVARYLHSQADQTDIRNMEYDMHNVICDEGIYLQITNTGGASAAVSVEFS
jgi:hypothetical protein